MMLKLLFPVMHMYILIFLFSFSFSFMLDIHVASLNMNGARQSLKRAELFEVMKQKNIDVMFLQETQ